jgi:AcrR family transcriptional regulator
MIKLVRPPNLSLECHDQILAGVTKIIAKDGARTPALRGVAEQAGMTSSQLTTIYGGKQRLIAASFAATVARDLSRLSRLIEEHYVMSMGAGMIPSLLWAYCEEAFGSRREDWIVLTELLVGPHDEGLLEILKNWILSRHELLRAMALFNGIGSLAIDILGLMLLVEAGFAISNGDSISYRVVARAGIEEAFIRLTGVGHAECHDELAGLVDRYFINSDYRPAEATLSQGGDDDGDGKVAIIDAAAVIIEERGAEAVSFQSVATRAAVSTTVVRYYFQSIHELTLAGLRRIIETLAASVATGPGAVATRDALLEARRAPAEAPKGDLMWHRGVLQISLAAARSKARLELGHLARRHIGMVSYAAIDPNQRISITRPSTTAYSLWSAAAYLVAPTLGENIACFDFNAQALTAKQCLLTAERHVSLIDSPFD